MTSKKTRRALLSSAISLLLCCSMLVGTTFAWFTDSVTSTGNIIKSGTLDVEMSWSNTKDGEYKDASKGAIFDYKYWEPGYVDIKYIKLENVGDLAFKYELTVNPAISNADGNKLAEVIDVYAAIVKDGFAEPSRSTVESMTKLGTLNNLMGANLADDGVLLPKVGKGSIINVETPAGTEKYEGEVTVCLALKMQETAGNEYQNLSIGDGFAVQMLATQFTYEKDSIGNDYDASADNSPSDAYPMALVKYAADKVGVPLPANASIPAFSVGGEILDTGYTFTAPETAQEANLSKYATWHADFVVSFDRDLKNSDKLALAGEYGTWGWLGAYAVDDTKDDDYVILPAGESVRLLQLFLGDDTSMNYEGLCSDVVNFTCGAWAKGNLEPLTMTVELRLFEAPSEGTTAPVWVETGKSILIGKYSHTFDVEIDTAEKLAAVLTSTDKNINVVLANDIDLPISSLGTMTGGSGEYKLGGDDTEKITIDLNGKKLNITTTYWSAIGAKNEDAIFTIKNGTMTSSQPTGTWNSYNLTFDNCNYVIEDVTFDKAIALCNDGKTVDMKNVTINETHDYYALWISAVGQNVTIDGLTVNSDGRGIKIDEQYVGSPAKVTLKVSDSEFTTASKAAIVVKSAAGADIAVNNVDITGVDADSINAVWVDEDAASYADLVTVVGATKIIEP